MMTVDLLCFFYSVFNQIFPHDFLDAVADVVHALHPGHLIFRFQLLGDSISFCHLSHELLEHIIGSSINFLEIGV